MTDTSLPASGFMVCLKPSKTFMSPLLPITWALASLTPTLVLVDLMLPTERLEIRSQWVGACPGAREVAELQRGGTGWEFPVSQEWNLSLGWGLECPGVMGSGRAPPSTPPEPGATSWLAECELNTDYVYKDQPLKNGCVLSRQNFLSLGHLSGALKRSFFFYKTMN